MVHGKTFPYYNEALITFLPTYKYDVGTDEYDSSDKARIPAWCDRVLTKGNNLRQIHYNTAPLKFSDHRPVYATFQCTITVVDEKKKEQISEGLYKQRRAAVGHHTAAARGEDSDDEDLIGYESIEPGLLPPASSDKRKWWLDGGMPVRSQTKPPAGSGDSSTRDGQGGYIRNPQRPVNPFSTTSEPDWVKVPRPEAPVSRASSVRHYQQDHSPASAASSRAPSAAPSTATANRKLAPILPPHSKSPAISTKTSTPTPSVQSRNNASSSTISTISTITRKAAPPVPKKPSTLRSESPNRTHDNHAPRLPTRTNTLPSHDASGIVGGSGVGSVQGKRIGVGGVAVFPPAGLPPPRRSTVEVNARGIGEWNRQASTSTAAAAAAAATAAAAKMSQGGRGESGGPMLPPRKAVAVTGRAQQQKNLLDDEGNGDDVGMSGWQPLKPT
jgi:hypothetical protein